MRPLIETSPVNGHFLSIYVPSMASLGVLNPRPTFLVYLGSLIRAAVPFLFKNTVGCFWNTLSFKINAKMSLKLFT